MLVYIFFALYLICLSIIADRYHKNLRKIVLLQMTLKNPKADKQLLWKQKDNAVFILKRERRFSYWALLGLALLHQISGFIAVFIEWHTQFELDVLYFSPVVELVVFWILLAIIFWLKGEGGGVPRSGEGDSPWSNGI
jgi:hypothetical protein